jgi:hypothetical protein
MIVIKTFLFLLYFVCQDATILTTRNMKSTAEAEATKNVEKMVDTVANHTMNTNRTVRVNTNFKDDSVSGSVALTCNIGLVLLSSIVMRFL